MKVIAINGSPRKKWNTATLIKRTLEGAESQGAETEIIHLYDLEYKGCKSCFSCKIIGSSNYGKCEVQDDLTGIFGKIENADALILGSPVYLGTVTGMMKSFMDRLVFQYLIYSDPISSLFPNKIKTRFIYTMNVDQNHAEEAGYAPHFNNNENFLNLTFGECQSLYSFDTYQFKDYSKVVMECFDPEHKREVHEKQFPLDLEKAYKMGAELVK